MLVSLKKIVKKIFLLAIALGISFGVLVYIAFYSNAWVYFPNHLKSQTALSRLKISVQSHIYNHCEGKCLKQQKLYKETVANFLFKNPEIIDNQIKKEILNAENIPEWRSSLIEIVSMSLKKQMEAKKLNQIYVPQYLVDFLYYLQKERYVGATGDVHWAIIENLVPLNKKQFAETARRVIYNNSLDFKTRTWAMVILPDCIGEDKFFDEFENLILDKNGDAHLRSQAILGMIPDKLSKDKQLKFYNELKKIIEDRSESICVQACALKTFGDYCFLDNKKIKNKAFEYLKSFYFNKANDPLLRDHAGNILNLVESNYYPEKYPEVKIQKEENNKFNKNCYPLPLYE